MDAQKQRATGPDTVLTGSRIAMQVEVGDDISAQFMCSSCGKSLRGSRVVMAIPSPALFSASYYLTHERPECVAASGG